MIHREKHPYNYDRLGTDRSIRLCRLAPSSTPEAPLELELFEACLDELPVEHQFEALSYTWGASAPAQDVRCHGKYLTVTPNCAAALRHLRQADSCRTLWIDAICIDQGHSTLATEERNVQVALMGQIYSKAVRTLCWLGAGFEYSREVVKHLDNIGRCPSKRGLAKLMRFEGLLHAQGVLDTESSCLDHIFCHDWHSRVWTVQEVAFSHNCHVVCGDAMIEWERYSAAATFLIFEQFIGTLDIKASSSMTAIAMRDVLRNYVLGLPIPGSDHDEEGDAEHRRVTFLMSCFTDVIYLAASEPKDKIYGLLAMYADLGVPFGPVDYSKSVAQVFTDATLAIITWSGSLRLLVDACGHRRDAALPSWVPDWRDADNRLFMPHSNATRGSSRSISPLDHLSSAKGKLLVRGKMVGRVDSTIMSFPTRPESCVLKLWPGVASLYAISDVAFLRLLVDKIRFLRELLIYLQASAREQELGSDMFLDIVTLGTGVPDSQSESLDVLLDLLQYPETPYDLSSNLSIVDRWRDGDERNAAHWTPEVLNCVVVTAALVTGRVYMAGEPLQCLPEVLDLVKDLSANLADQAVYHISLHNTEELSLGTACAAVAADDLVFLLEGADWPVVLKPASADAAAWRFVSPAFVQNIMDGEAWSSGADDATDPSQTFELI